MCSCWPTALLSGNLFLSSRITFPLCPCARVDSHITIRSHFGRNWALDSVGDQLCDGRAMSASSAITATTVGIPASSLIEIASGARRRRGEMNYEAYFFLSLYLGAPQNRQGRFRGDFFTTGIALLPLGVCRRGKRHFFFLFFSSSSPSFDFFFGSLPSLVTLHTQTHSHTKKRSFQHIHDGSVACFVV